MVRFGPSGNSPSFYEAGFKHSIDAPKWLNAVGLSAYEFSFGRGYIMSEPTAKKIGEEAKFNDIEVSVHAPFYINLANLDDAMIEKSYAYILKGLKYVELMNGKILVVHLASQGKLLRKEALLLTKNRLEELLVRVYDKKMTNIYISPETMGKSAQIGNHEEIIDFCTMDKLLIPTFDFGHINSLTAGGLKTKEDYKRIFDLSLEKLGEFKTKNCHIHFSKIQYGDKGEIKHLNYDDTIYGPDFEPLAEVICEYGLTPTIICESKDFMAEDALILQKIYQNVNNTRH